MGDSANDMAIREAFLVTALAVELRRSEERRAMLVSSDILPRLISHFDQPTLAAAMSVHTSFNKLAGPLLYSTVTFDYSEGYFLLSPAAQMMEVDCGEEYSPVGDDDTLGEYGKAHYLKRYMTTLEIINHSGGPKSDWSDGFAHLRHLCPRLGVLRIKGPASWLVPVYKAVMVERTPANWTPQVVEFVVSPSAILEVRTQNPVLSQLTLRDFAHIETHLRIDLPQPMETSNEMFQSYVSLFGTDPKESAANLRDTSALYVDFVGGFGSNNMLKSYISMIAALFLWTRTTLHVTWYLEYPSENDASRARKAAELFKRKVVGNQEYCAEINGKRLDGCQFTVLPLSKVGDYTSIKYPKSYWKPIQVEPVPDVGHMRTLMAMMNLFEEDESEELDEEHDGYEDYDAYDAYDEYGNYGEYGAYDEFETYEDHETYRG